jgi:uncharacterized protein (DUF952 family)
VDRSRLFHLLFREAWSRLGDAALYEPESLTTEGFIHLSTLDQVLRTAERYFAGRADVMVLAIDTSRLDAPVRYEEAHGDRFPHLYGPLPMQAVIGVEPLPLVGGSFVFPTTWR